MIYLHSRKWTQSLQSLGSSHLPTATSHVFRSCLPSTVALCLHNCSPSLNLPPNPLPTMPQCLPRWTSLWGIIFQERNNCSLKGFATSVPQTDQYYILNPKAFSFDSLPHLFFIISAIHTEHPLPASILGTLQNEDKPFGSKEAANGTRPNKIYTLLFSILWYSYLLISIWGWMTAKWKRKLREKNYFGKCEKGKASFISKMKKHRNWGKKVWGGCWRTVFYVSIFY